MKFPEIAKRFTHILNLRQMTAQELADKSGVGKSSISHYVNGSNEPHSDILPHLKRWGLLDERG